MNERREWLDGLKAGDRVAIVRGWEHIPQLGTVEKTTEKSVWVVGIRFNRDDGDEYGNRHSMARLYPITPEIRANIQRARLLRKLRELEWSSLTTEKLGEVYALLYPDNPLPPVA